ncbi:MAG: TonB-dependent receptor, partial [Saprospiraceae bacterium]|nr:TonB-dependent receptor [Saprospiraceae bacterium]
SIDVRQLAMNKLLDLINTCPRLSYRWIGNQVVFYQKIRKFTLSGYVQDAETGERLIGATVRVQGPGTTAGAISNEFGFFSLPVEEGAYSIFINYIGYHPRQETVQMDADRLLTVRLPSSGALPEVLVTANPIQEGGASSTVLTTNLPIRNLAVLPMPGGEADLQRLAAFQTGVKTGVDGLGGLHVRGGNSDQNLILLDDVPVYNPNHALGLFSVFNPSTVHHARLWKGDFPARYGGRAASVLDIRTRDGHFRENHGEVTAGLFAASATLEGPLISDTASFLLSGRTTYFGPWIDLFSRRENLLNFSGDQIAYRFYDVNAKVNYVFSPQDRVYLSYYQGGDVFRNQFEQRFDDPEGLIMDAYTLNSDWGNAIAALRWNHLIRKNLFTNTTLRFSRFYYQSQLGFLSNFLAASGKENLLANYGQFYQTLIQDWSGKTDFSFFPSERLTLRWGIAYTFHTFQPGALSVNFLVPGQSPITIDSLSEALLNNERLRADEAELYLDTEWQIWKHWTLEAGLNFSSFQIRNQLFGALQPRLKLQRRGANGWQQWVGFHRTAQYLHQIGSFNISLPFELWVPSTGKVPPERTWQGALGAGWVRDGWQLRLEAYYKRFEQVLTFLSSNTALFAGGAEDASGWEDRVASGTGNSYGLEFSLEKQVRPVKIGLNYSWSKADRKFPDINSGRTFPFRFDRRHDLNIHLQCHITNWLNVSLVWAFATGNPITLSGVKFQHHSPNGDLERNVFVYTEVNGYRLPAYHRLDAAVNASFGRGKLEHAIQLGAYNVYNRATPFFLYVDSGSGDGAKAIQYTLLPALPAFRYSVKF